MTHNMVEGINVNDTTVSAEVATTPKFDAEAERRAIAAQATQEECIELRDALREMNTLRREALGDIISMTQMARGWMRDPECYRSPSVLEGVLQAIWRRAESLNDWIGSTAMKHGCDDDEESHFGALRAAVEKARWSS